MEIISVPLKTADVLSINSRTVDCNLSKTSFIHSAKYLLKLSTVSVPVVGARDRTMNETGRVSAFLKFSHIRKKSIRQ